MGKVRAWKLDEFFESGEGKIIFCSGWVKVLSPCPCSPVLAEVSLGWRALSSELFMGFQWYNRRKRLRTKQENQHFLRWLWIWPQREEYPESQSNWQICAPPPVLKSFLGHLGQAPTVMRVQSSFTKLKSLPGGRSFHFHCYKSPVVSLWLLSIRPNFQSLPSQQRGAFLSPDCALVFGESFEKSHL